MRRFAVASVIALGIAACGGSVTPRSTTTNGARTASDARVSQLDQADESCANAQLVGQTVNTSECASVSSADAAINTIECGAGLSTSGSCVFARKVQDGYAAADGATGHAPNAFVVTAGQATDPNPVSCSGTVKSWRCVSERNPAVWVAYRQP